MNTLPIIKIDTATATAAFDRSLFENISWSKALLRTRGEIAAALDGKNPYTITVVIDPLKWELRNKKEYVKKTKSTIISKL